MEKLISSNCQCVRHVLRKFLACKFRFFFRVLSFFAVGVGTLLNTAVASDSKTSLDPAGQPQPAQKGDLFSLSYSLNYSPGLSAAASAQCGTGYPGVLLKGYFNSEGQPNSIRALEDPEPVAYRALREIVAQSNGTQFSYEDSARSKAGYAPLDARLNKVYTQLRHRWCFFI
jgi:hypothetical protein